MFFQNAGHIRSTLVTFSNLNSNPLGKVDSAKFHATEFNSLSVPKLKSLPLKPSSSKVILFE